MVKLHDGVNDVSVISVLCICKDNEIWLKYATAQFENYEKIYDVEFEYFFYQNNSSDNTCNVVSQFLQSRKGKLISDDQPKYTVSPSGTNFDRTRSLSYYRNSIIEANRPFHSEWSILIDSNIVFQPDLLLEMFKCHPKKNNITMVTPFTAAINKYNNQEAFTSNHYYDTFAFVSNESKSYWPNCIFKTCSRCKLTSIPESQNVVDVDSAFGGFALIESDNLNNNFIKYDTISAFENYSLCEHVLFCKSLKTLTNKRIVILQSTRDKIFYIP